MSAQPDAAALHPSLAPLSFLLGRWRGVGVGGYPTVGEFRYAQELEVTHHGAPALVHSARSWLIDDDGTLVRPAAAEAGFWRMPAGPDDVELVLAHPSGIVEVYVGRVDGTKVELQTDVVARTATAKEVSANHRLYGTVEGALLYAVDMAAVGQPLQPHLSARLERVTAG